MIANSHHRFSKKQVVTSRAMNFILCILFLVTLSCSDDETEVVLVDDTPSVAFKYLALGDSYTKGEAVCDACKFPSQLQDSLQNYLTSNEVLNLKVVAQTGWTTTNLKTAIINENLNAEYDLVTLLIGVNNQYQNKPFSLYEQEFPELLNTAITVAKGDLNRVIVVSIPDYAYTLFGLGGNEDLISSQIDQYNLFAKNHTESLGITFVNITDITRQGLANPALVAYDNLHPSELAYTKFVERLLPIAKIKLGID
jgi:lysophospholipase L1-like esterase